MHGSTYTPESSSPSQSPTPSRSRSASPQKRPQNGYVNGSTNGESKHSDASPVPRKTTDSHTNKSPPTLFYGHEKEQVARILIQGLQDLGYSKAAETLVDESGHELESSSATAFRNAILGGDWIEAESLLPGGERNRRRSSGMQHNGKGVANGHSPQQSRPTLTLKDDADRDEMLFLIRQQKFLELLEQGDATAALTCLRSELHALHQDQRHLHALSSLIMCQTPEEVKQQADWDGADGTSRRELLSSLANAISPSIMLRDHRLAHLLSQWKDAQINNCLYHNDLESPSLYHDHVCTRDDFPLDPIQELDHHSNEVWYVGFSNDGSMMASSGQDRTVAIYDTNEFRLRHVLAEHRDGVAAIAWSPDDKHIVSCSLDKEARLWDVQSGRCIRVLKYHDDPVTCAAWAPDGQSFVIGAHDHSKPLSIWGFRSSYPDPSPLHTFEKPSLNRVQDCVVSAVTPPRSFEIDATTDSLDSQHAVRLAALCVDCTIHVYDYHRRQKLRQIDVGHNLTSISMSRDGQEMIVNLGCNEVWALSVEDGIVRRKYQGQVQGHYIIRGCYGGADDGVVVSGGEDGRICIWHRHSARLLEQLEGHTPASVNTVAWNHANPRIFASAGDDYKVRIWAAINSDLGSAAMMRDAHRKPPSNAHLGSHGDRSAPQWGSSAGSGGGSALTALMRR
ncbi:MAG: hypothetical protein Q9162_007699 [Coniocarpon cinnabarinum]